MEIQLDTLLKVLLEKPSGSTIIAETLKRQLNMISSITTITALDAEPRVAVYCTRVGTDGPILQLVKAVKDITNKWLKESKDIVAYCRSNSQVSHVATSKENEIFANVPHSIAIVAIDLLRSIHSDSDYKIVSI